MWSEMMGCNYRHCLYSWHDRELKFARTVIFAVEEINRDTKLLPGVTLGYKLYNGCGDENLIRAAVEAVNGGDSRDCTGQIQALLGHSSSGLSKDINIILSPLSIPQVTRSVFCFFFKKRKLFSFHCIDLFLFASLGNTDVLYLTYVLFFKGKPFCNLCLFE